jgi:hypothetical protein
MTIGRSRRPERKKAARNGLPRRNLTMTRNRSLILMGTLAGTLLVPTFARADDGAAPKGTGIAILTFRVASTANGNRAIGEDVADSTINALTPALRGKALRAIERMRLNDVLGELKISDTGIVDPNEATRIGKAAGARYVLLGSVTDADSCREDDTKTLNKYSDGLPDGFVEALASKLPTNGLGGTVGKILGGGGSSKPKQPEYVTLVSLEARVVSLAEADGEASYQVVGFVKNKNYKPDFAGAVADASSKLAKLIAKSVTTDGHIEQPQEEVANAKDPKNKKNKKNKGDKGDPEDVSTPAPSPSPAPANADAGKIEGRILDSEKADEVALKLNKGHGLKAGQKFKMRWVQAVGGDNSVRKTKGIYLVEITETDTGGVILKITATEKGDGLPGENETVILEPEK